MEGRMDVRFTPHKCPVCNGFGTLRYGAKICQACNGTGAVVIDNQTGLLVEGQTEGKKDEQ
jgi:DnaJ-class molecular chaperone